MAPSSWSLTTLSNRSAMLAWTPVATLLPATAAVFYMVWHHCRVRSTTSTATPQLNDASVTQLKEALDRMSRLRLEERTGRIRAERRIKALHAEVESLKLQLEQQQQRRSTASDIHSHLAHENGSSTEHLSDNSDNSDNSDQRSKDTIKAHASAEDVPMASVSHRSNESTSQTYVIKPIGHVISPFPDRRGTPRQPSLAPNILGKIRILQTFQPAASLDGLQNFSHIWVVFIFHKSVDSVSRHFKAKVAPPALDGARTGCFACRTPHRPNPIGLSLVRLVGVEGDTLTIAGHDLMDGTPVVDIKPYVPFVEGLHNATAPAWVSRDRRQLMGVTVSDEARNGIRLSACRVFASVDAFVRALCDVLSYDIRSNHQRDRQRQTLPHPALLTAPAEFELRFDDHKVMYRFDNEDRVLITKIEPVRASE